MKRINKWLTLGLSCSTVLLLILGILAGSKKTEPKQIDIQPNTIAISAMSSESTDRVLPSAYNSKEHGRSVKAMNQGNTTNCWAYASLAALEDAALPTKTLKLSVEHMVKSVSQFSNVYDGGEYTRAVAYLSSWMGPVTLNDNPFGVGISNAAPEVAGHVQEVQFIQDKNLDKIKNAVMDYGGVTSSFYAANLQNFSASPYYNRDTAAYYYAGVASANHDIVIIGWDDHYSKDNFSLTPPGNGAFLCMNSWGADFGNEGVFAISYYDVNIGTSSVFYSGIEDTDNYDTIYQADQAGWVGQAGYGKDTAQVASVYTANADSCIEAVSFYATGADTSVEVAVRPKFTNAADLQNLTYVQSLEYENAGYYTIRLSEPVFVQAGEKFAVCLKITTPDSEHPVAIEYESGTAAVGINIDDGESYLSLDGQYWEHLEETKACNACVKAFAREI